MWESAGWMAVIALFGAYIAHQQFVVNRERFKLDLFERRLLVYESSRAALRDICGLGQVGDKQLADLISAAGAAKFLFGKSVNRFLDGVLSRATSMHAIEINLDRIGIGGDVMKAAQKQADLHNRKAWLLQEANNDYEALAGVFAKEMAFAEIPPLTVHILDILRRLSRSLRYVILQIKRGRFLRSGSSRRR